MELDIYLLGERGRAASVAKAVGVTPVTVHQWAFDSKKQVPTERCPAIEQATAGEVSCEILRPDVTWVRVKDKSWPHPNGRPLVDHSTKKAA